ncbi:MAG TPA: DMT family transporter [Candidatus Pullichristensenella excrementigallinarum]|uniref:DMT family transporter n=1 Tax=Candidatus Pullichristensenella excrementigallinarum TaxID=2840907 RepID=A0A9D1ID72_9FIRM|nr:DMT family transporter [Candidatus Pullichristensenella excrementigallinarum]
MRNGRGILEIVLSCASWSFAGLLSKFLPWNGLSISGVRALVAVLILGLYRKSFRPRLTRGCWLGAFGVVSTSVIFIFANKLTSAANAIVLQYAMPAVVIVYTAIARRRLPGLLDVGTVLVVLVGVTLCFCQAFESGGMLGNILALITAGTFAVVFLAGQREDCDALSYAYLGNLVAMLLIFYIPLDQGFTWEPIHWLTALAMGLCLGLGYLFFGMGMRDGVSSTMAAIVANVEPVLSPTWCFLFLGEKPGPLTIVGAAIVLVAVTCYTILASKKRSPA